MAHHLHSDEANLIIYADDLHVVLTGKPHELNMMKKLSELILKNVKQWYDLNGLQVNANKTQCIITGSKHNIHKVPQDFTISFDGKAIPISTKVKSLGIWLDKNRNMVR
jgi:hypothetical protein